jgi:hypothetical protein
MTEEDPSLQRMKVLSPATKVGNLGGIFDSSGFGEEALDLRAVFKAEGSDAEGRGNSFHEAADGVFGESPDFELDARAIAAGRVDETGLGG